MQARAFSERTQAKKLDRTRSSGVMPRAAANNGIEEMFVQNESVSLCLLLNRRTKTMRVIDFRAGPSHAKRLFVLKLAKREGIEKVYTLVERDETHTWMKLGFDKEANIPGFYKRSDAFLLGVGVDEALATEIKGSLEATSADDDDDDDTDVAPPKASPAHDRMEKTLVQAKKQAKALLDRPLPITKMTQVKASDIQKTVDKAVRSGTAMTAFEPFGRDVERRYFLLTAKNNFELVTSIGSQGCFANAFLELLSSPSTEHERLATVSALRTINDKLLGEGVVSCFALAPSDDIALATAFVFNGFRRTGLLQGHMLVKGERKDAIVWSRKLADPKEV